MRSAGCVDRPPFVRPREGSMRRVLLIALTVVLGLPAISHAQDPGVWKLPPGTRPPVTAPLPSVGTGQVGGETPSRVTPDDVKARTVRTCRSRGQGRRRIRVCRYFSGKRLVARCTKRPGRHRRCRRFAKGALRTGGGYVQNPIPAIGRFYSSSSGSADHGLCSGTLVTN